MPGPSLLTAAVEELYAVPPGEFIARRKTLAAAAKKAGDRGAATAIGALRKPSLSADTVNRLVRGAPDEVDELLKLGTDLRAAEAALDAGELRRLGDRRRRLVNDLADLAFELTGQAHPSATVRDEVTATLNAALADDEVARRLASGALVTQARWDGFGSTQLPELAASMPDLPPARRRPKPAPVAQDVPEESKGPEQVPEPVPAAPDRASDKPTAAQRAERQRAAARQAEQERAAAKQSQQAEQQRAAAEQEAARRAAAVEKAAEIAEEAAEAAAQAAARAAEAQELVSTIDRRISELNLQLAHQRRLLADAQRALKAAENARRAAALAATRAGATGH